MAAAAIRARLDNLVTSMFTTVSPPRRHPIPCTPRPCGCSGGWLTLLVHLRLRSCHVIHLGHAGREFPATAVDGREWHCSPGLRHRDDQPLHQRHQEDPQRHRRNQPVVDYDIVDVLVRQLKGCSYIVGAKKVNLSCMQFRRFYEPRSKERCLMALALAWNEFCEVRSKFEAMMQLEEQIAAYGPN
ncbi:hypothetical protein CFC21_060059 [Triticum aestivum]|uniref:Histidine-containing phosphotransfer protein n=2 Tax=Triticum aestivum TaxID=4565 RepID=A0A9R1GQL6_WHEAT|nr:hypothetical protein CFC21_060059 [Triticum aestivum]